MILGALLAEGGAAPGQEGPGQEVPGQDRATAQPAPLDVARTLALLRDRGSALGSLDDTTVRAMISTFHHNSSLLRSHNPAVYRGDVIHFTATKGRPADLPDGKELWRPYVAGTLEDQLIEATHIGLVAPASLDYIAKVISERLATIEAAD